MLPSGILRAALSAASADGANLGAWGAAWARFLPTVLLVPAFGLGVLPIPLRVAMAFALAAACVPALHSVPELSDASWPLMVARELAHGLPVAIAASASLWAATVAGGVADTALGVRVRTEGTLFGRTGAASAGMATLLGLAAAVAFLDGGGASWVVSRLSSPPLDPVPPLSGAVFDLAAGVGIGAAIGAPLLVVALIVDLTTSLVGREFPALRASAALAPIKTLVVLVATAALLDRIAEALVLLGPATR